MEYIYNELKNDLQTFLNNYKNLNCSVAIIKNDKFATLVEANDLFYKIIGYQKDEFFFKHQNKIKEILVDYNKYNSQENLSNNDYDVNYDLRIFKQNNQIIWIRNICHYNSKTDSFFVMSFDITNIMISTTTTLSYDAFHIKNEIIWSLNNYTSKNFIVTDILTDKIMYMSDSVMKLCGYENESDWMGKNYLEIVFGSIENVDSKCYIKAREDKFETI